MMVSRQRLYADINPKLLTWARESAKLSLEQIATKFNKTIEDIEAWENGENPITIPQLRTYANFCHRHISVFFLPGVPEDFQAMRDYRKLPTQADSEPRLYMIQRQIQDAEFRREVALELLSEQKMDRPKMNYHPKLTDDPEKIGARIRKILGITKDLQLDVPEIKEMFRIWRGALENAGVLVFQARGIDIEDMRGFSISEYPLPVIVVNGKDTPGAKIFTLIHEFAHILMNKSGICDMKEGRERDPEDNKFEVFCNYVAGATLLPKELLMSDELVESKLKSTQPDAHGVREIGWTNEDLTNLSLNKFKVSREVVLRRLLIANLTSNDYYNQMRTQINLPARDDIEIDAEPTSSGGGIGTKRDFVWNTNYFLSNISHPFAQIVLDGYHQKRIYSSIGYKTPNEYEKKVITQI